MLSSHHTCYPTSSASLICPFLSILSVTAQSHTLITSFLEPHNSPQLEFRSSPFTSKRPYIVLQNEPYYYRAMSHHSNPLSLTLLAGEERLQDPFHLAQTYILALSSLVSMCTLLKKKSHRKLLHTTSCFYSWPPSFSSSYWNPAYPHGPLQKWPPPRSLWLSAPAKAWSSLFRAPVAFTMYIL